MIAFYLFIVCLLLLFYTYIGYGILLFMLVKIKQGSPPLDAPTKQAQIREGYQPPVTVVIAAYNEADFIETKITDTLRQNYPPDKLHILAITDGSTDSTPEIVKKFEQVQLFHQPERRGKIAAVNRVMPLINTPIVIYTDANTLLNPDAVSNLTRHFANPNVGAVAGEKRIITPDAVAASGAGEGLYWKYESALKKWDSELYSVVGAAGELFAIRTDLYEPPPPDTLIEDFYKTLRIAQKGYRVLYEPDAYAMETPSASVAEELKRKIRIAAGGLQAIYRLKPLLNPFKYGVLSFQYISHRVLRWTLAPLCLPILLLTNAYLVRTSGSIGWQVFLGLQVIFYLTALTGYLLEARKIRFKPFFVPYYFCMMNYAVYLGFWRIVTGRQSVLWERAKRGQL